MEMKRKTEKMRRKPEKMKRKTEENVENQESNHPVERNEPNEILIQGVT